MTSPYLVPDILAHDLKVVFCGTALGHESARRRAYYAHPGNAFWKTLHRLGLTPRLVAPEDYAQVLDYGIGLTDLCKTESGNDHELPDGCFDGASLKEKITRYQPRFLAFTSKNAASGFLGTPAGQIPYGLQKEMLGQTRIFVLSSPSGQARRWWREEVWEALAQELRNG